MKAFMEIMCRENIMWAFLWLLTLTALVVLNMMIGVVIFPTLTPTPESFALYLLWCVGSGLGLTVWFTFMARR